MVRPRRILLVLATAATALVGTVVLGELSVRIATFLISRGRPDYADAIDGGRLRPGFSADVVGGDGRAVRWTNNTAGFRSEHEFAREPPAGTLRVLSIGDSFTAGYRVGNDETFSYLLEAWLNETLGPAEVLINGTEDLDNGLDYFVEAGASWSPHVLVVGITLGNDIAQAYVSRDPESIGFRNGLEELSLPADSLDEPTRWSRLSREIVYASMRSRLIALIRPRRAITSWYGHVHPPRLFDPINGFGIFLSDAPPEVDDAYERLFTILDELRAEADRRNTHLILAVFPQRYQVQPEDWTGAQRAYGLNPDAFDLARPNARIADYCRQRSLDCLDPTEYMRAQHEATGEAYYQPLGDMHWNARGHREWLDGAKPELLAVLTPIAARAGVAR